MTTATAELTAAAAFGAGVAAVTDRLRRSVVVVRSGAGTGAGTAWGTDGTLVTNHHVAHDDRVQLEAWDGRTYEARVTARDPEHDLATLRAEGLALTPVERRDPSTLRAGELVLAVGHPWGRKGDAALGIILTAAAPPAGAPLQRGVYTDVRLAPGNSGGPLADAAGRVVGINSMVAGGMGVAIPAHVVEEFVARGAAERGVLGLAALAVPLAGSNDTAGLLVTQVFPGSAAETAGLIPGDIVVGVEGARGDLEAVGRQLARLVAGQPVRIEVLRGGEPLTLTALAAAA